ncbi:glycosyltransferase family 2 protein [Halomicroarcula sp. S1AR25-4]|uniref:glycosyltransferase family 2 protein n=1 Tax=Haloarcula sp. S1AR25-4 TaxID=2950538 RepID=UPI002874A813|nr:glycosyltransferase family 2 protein [Halomicroarcula sp. S1AR25-4]MDS0278470.1 glycosyltransferase family 2 protein [Halomicroarcula sp. S1AR25-4]
MNGTKPKVQVVVVNYNGKDHLDYALPSIRETAYPNYDIEVVDNNSSDGSVEYVRENYPSISVTELDQNRGWAGGNNVGIRHGLKKGAEYIVLVNNDIRVHPEWLSAAVAAGEAHSDVGFIGFDVYGTVSSVPLEEFERAVEDWERASQHYTDEFIDGMALCIKSLVFADIGLLDDEYFLYADETDFEIRGQRAGYKRMKTNVPVWHYSSGTTEEIPTKASYFAIRNHIRLSVKHESVVGVFRKILLLYYVGCHPWFDGDMNDRINQRRRPRGVVFNFFLVTYCVLWNVVYLPQTLRTRREEYRRIDCDGK